MVLIKTTGVLTKVRASIKNKLNMYMYLNIVILFLINNSKVNIIRFL